VAERARFTEVTPGDPEVPRGNRRFRRRAAEPPRELPKVFTDPDAWPNKLPPLPTRGEMLLDQYGQARGMCIQQRGHQGPHRTDAMRAEARGEKSVPRYQGARR
jgi:hypothetical protein